MLGNLYTSSINIWGHILLRDEFNLPLIFLETFLSFKNCIHNEFIIFLGDDLWLKLYICMDYVMENNMSVYIWKHLFMKMYCIQCIWNYTYMYLLTVYTSFVCMCLQTCTHTHIYIYIYIYIYICVCASVCVCMCILSLHKKIKNELFQLSCFIYHWFPLCQVFQYLSYKCLYC